MNSKVLDLIQCSEAQIQENMSKNLPRHCLEPRQACSRESCSKLRVQVVSALARRRAQRWLHRSPRSAAVETQHCCLLITVDRMHVLLICIAREIWSCWARALAALLKTFVQDLQEQRSTPDYPKHEPQYGQSLVARPVQKLARSIYNTGQWIRCIRIPTQTVSVIVD